MSIILFIQLVKNNKDTFIYMQNIDNEFLKYLEGFVNTSDYTYLLNVYDKKHAFDDTTTTDPEYLNLTTFYNRLLNLTDKYRVEVDCNCTSLIEKLFARYVNADTFVLTTEQEHPAVKAYLPAKNTFIISINELDNPLAISQIITKFRQTSYKKLFLIMSGVVAGSSKIIKQSFFEQLKVELNKAHIPHLFVLDDCQGLFMTPRNYAIFDAILGTAHVIVRYGFSMGILFTKLPDRIGYINKASLKAFINKLKYVFNHKAEATRFNTIVHSFLGNEIDGNILNVKAGQASHMITISTTGVKFNQRSADELSTYGMLFSELNTKNRLIRLRYQDAILFNPRAYLDGLYKLKRVLHSLKKMNEFAIDLSFDNSIDIDYEFTVNNINKPIGEINKNIYRSDFNINEIERVIKQSQSTYVGHKEAVYNYIFNRQR